MAEEGEPESEAAATVADDGGTGVEPWESKPPRSGAGLEQVGRYRILEELGSGGMGVVYRARDPELDREVAVKIVHRTALTKSPALRERTLREAQAMARLSHPNVVEVYDVGHDGDVLFIAMQIIGGPTLKDWTGRTWREVLDNYLAAGEALAAAHAQDLVHRDFKPQNVMLDSDGEVKVLDFGLARLISGGSTSGADWVAAETQGELASSSSALDVALTDTGVVLGTPAYMAPEQFLGGTVDERSDQFSFCVSLWEGLHGERPYPGGRIDEVRRSVLAGRVRAPAGSGVPGAVQKVLRRGLRIKPTERYPDMPTLLAALRGASRQLRLWWVGAAALLASVAGVAVWTTVTRDQPCAAADEALGSTWDDTREQVTADAVLGSGQTYAESTWARLSPRLDEWAEQWKASHAEICTATRVQQTQSAELLDVRMGCLERGRDHMDAFLEVLGEGREQAVRGALGQVAAMPSPTVCVTVEASRPRAADVAPEVASKISDLRRKLEVAKARRRVGAYGPALDAAVEVVARARELDDPGLKADALQTEGKIRRFLGEAQLARERLNEAYLTATAADDPVRATKAAAELLFVVGIELARPEESLQWYRHARAELDRLPAEDPEMESRLLSTLGAVQGEMGDLEESTKTQLRALELMRRAVGPEDIALVQSLDNAAMAHRNQSKFDEAIELAEEAAAISVANLGPDHPDVARPWQFLSRLLDASGNHERAREVAQRAVDLTVASYGEGHLFSARAVVLLGTAHQGGGEHERALELFARAEKLFRAHLGDQHPELASLLEDKSRSLHRLKRYDEAETTLRDAIEIAEGALGADYPELAFGYASLAAIARDAGQLEASIGHYQHALSLNTDTPKRPKRSRSTWLVDLASVLHEAERYPEATEAYATALEHCETTVGRDSPLYQRAVAGREAAARRSGPGSTRSSRRDP